MFDPISLVFVCFPSFFACQNPPEVLKNIFYYFKIFRFGISSEKKRYLVEKIPILGDGGSVHLGIFPTSYRFFSEDVPNGL